MKTFALAATVAAGLLLTAGSADAQYRTRGGVVYGQPAYAYPTYNGVTSVGTHTPLGGTSVIIPNTGYAQPYSAPYTSGYYAPAPVYPTYGYSAYPPSYAAPSYNNMYVSPSGISVGGRVWRW